MSDLSGAPPIASTTVADVIVPQGNFGPTISGRKKKHKAASAYGQQISDEHASIVLGQGHPKSQRVKSSWRK